MSYNEDKYTPTINYPTKKDHISFRVLTLDGEKIDSYANSTLLKEAYSSEVVSKVNRVKNDAINKGKESVIVDDKIFIVIYDNDAYEADKKSYQVERQRLEELFYTDSVSNAGLDPKSKLARVVFSKAYDDGHSDGYYAVWNEVESLADFVEEVLEATKNDT